MVLVFQFRAPRYVPGVYWLVVVVLSIMGTLITDNLTDKYNVALETTTTLFAIALAVTFLAWYLVERTLSIHSIYTPRREAFYWLAILLLARLDRRPRTNSVVAPWVDQRAGRCRRVLADFDAGGLYAREGLSS